MGSVLLSIKLQNCNSSITSGGIGLGVSPKEATNLREKNADFIAALFVTKLTLLLLVVQTFALKGGVAGS